MKNKRSGFTLIELIAVMVILAIISFLVVPSIVKVMKDSKEKLYQEQVDLVLTAAKNYGVENYDELDEVNLTFLTLDKLISSGYIENDEAIDPRNNQAMDGCVMVSYNQSNKKYDYEYIPGCNKDKYLNVLNMSDNYTGDWQSEVVVNIQTSYLANDANTTYRYCVSTTKCSPNIGVDEPSGSISVDVESESTYVCAVSVTSTGHESETKCSGPFKVDKTAPVLTIPGNENLDSLVETYDFNKNVSAVDNVTPANQLTITRSGNISLGTLGTYTLTYTVKDKAGNVAIKKRTVNVVDVTDPQIQLAVAGSPFDANGWAKSGFKAAVSITDLGGSGVAGYKYCVSTAKCTPSTQVAKSSDQISADIDGTSIYVCAYGLDGSGNTSDTKCVGPYKVDKTDPTCSLKTSGNKVGEYFTQNATIAFNTYSSDVVSKGITTSTSASYSNATGTQSSDTNGQVWYGYVKDQSGRTGSCSVTVKRDTTAPTCSLKIDTSTSENGWYTQNVSVSFNSKSSDVTSYDVTTSSSASYNGNTSTTLSSSGTAYGYVKDRVGLTGSCNSSSVGAINIDKSAPNAPSVSVNGKTATLSASDNGSSNICAYRIDGGSWQSGNSFSGLGFGSHTAQVKDCAGNTSGTSSFTVNASASISTGGSGCWWSSGSCTGKSWHPSSTITNVSASTSGTSVTFTVTISIYMSQSWLHNGTGYARYMCLANHHTSQTASGNCVSNGVLLRADFPSESEWWKTYSTHTYTKSLTINNPSGCYDLQVYGTSATNAHISGNIINAVCVS